jgi:hypothetical protein
LMHMRPFIACSVRNATMPVHSTPLHSTPLPRPVNCPVTPRERETERQGDKERETERQGDKERETEKDRDRKRETERPHTCTHTDRSPEKIDGRMLTD